MGKKYFLHMMGLALGVWLMASGVNAADAPAQNQNILLEADQLLSDESAGVVTAAGNVELSHDARVLKADNLTYNQKTGVVMAVGNVRILEPSGEVLFADRMELTDDLRQGFVDQLKVRLTDDSRFAAASGTREDGTKLELNRAVYSPCLPCKKDPTRAPVWQIKANQITHDQTTRDITYRDAWLEMFGVPVLYTPYFSHPDPLVERRSGFLAPTVGRTKPLGAFLRGSYYVDITPDMDATIEAGYSQKDGPLIGGEWRQRFENGQLQINGALVHTDREEIDNGQSHDEEDVWRGYIFAKGLFDLDENWRAGFNLKRVTDNSFLRRYDYSHEDILKSNLFAEGFYGRSYANISAYDFQDLRPGIDADEEPIVLPWADVAMLGDPGGFLGGRWSFDAGALGLIRDDDNRDTGRLSAQAGWQRDWVADFGLVTTLQASIRADVYRTNHTEEAPDPFTSREPNDTKFRVFPQAQLLARYPLAYHGDTFSYVVEPIAAYTVASNPNNHDIPNEDSRDVEFDITNLFSSNRFAGVDRLEGGQSLTYGARLGMYGGRGNASLFLGQNYRFNEETDMPQYSGLEDRRSDYVGRADASFDFADFTYGFRLDGDTLESRRHDVTAAVYMNPVSLAANYIYLHDLEGVDDSGREEITLAGRLELTDTWSFSASHRRNLGEGNEPIYLQAGLNYQDECFGIGIYYEHDYTVREDLKSGDSIFFRLNFKNLGEVSSPTLSGAMLKRTDD